MEEFCIKMTKISQNSDIEVEVVRSKVKFIKNERKIWWFHRNSLPLHSK